MIFQPGEIIVFLVVMAFFFTFRLLDQKDRKIHKARKYIEKQSTYLQEAIDKRKKDLESLQESIDVKEASTREMLKRVETLLEEIDAHGNDLMQLQAQMNRYHHVLKELGNLTDSAEQRLQSVQRESREVEETEGRLQQLRTDLQRDIQQAQTVQQQLEELSSRKLTELSSESAEHAETRARSPQQPEVQSAHQKQYPAYQDGGDDPDDAEDRQQPEADSWEGFDADEDDSDTWRYPESFDDYDLDSIDEQIDSRQHPEMPETAEPEAEQKPAQPEAPIGTERKKDMVRSYRDQGLNASEIAEKMEITRGEVELLLEILRFSGEE